MHNFSDLIQSAEKGEVIEADFLQRLVALAVRQQASPAAFVDATGVYQRRWPASSPPSELVTFANVSGTTVPAYGVVCCYQTAYPANCPDFGVGVQSQIPGYGTSNPGIAASALAYYRGCLMGWAGGYFINTESDVAAGAIGQCSPAAHKPRMAAVSGRFGLWRQPFAVGRRDLGAGREHSSSIGACPAS